MKKLSRKLLIGTTVGLASLALNACDAQGTPQQSQVISDTDVQDTQEVPSDTNDNSSIAGGTEDMNSEQFSSSESSQGPEENASSSGSTGKITFEKVDTPAYDASSYLNSEVIGRDDLPEKYDPTQPIPTVYGPPVESK